MSIFGDMLSGAFDAIAATHGESVTHIGPNGTETIADAVIDREFLAGQQAHDSSRDGLTIQATIQVRADYTLVPEQSTIQAGSERFIVVSVLATGIRNTYGLSRAANSTVRRVV